MAAAPRRPEARPRALGARRGAAGAWLLAAGLAVSATVTAWQGYERFPYRPAVTLAVPADSAEHAQRDTTLAVWYRALAADTGSALVTSQLAGLHAARARDGVAPGDWLRADSLARRSLARRVQHNGAAGATLVAALLAQHRFADAVAEARELVAHHPDEPVYRAILGEAALEAGDDATARAMFTSVHGQRRALAMAPRVARWLEATGHVGDARHLLRTAADSIAAQHGTPAATRAWFALRRADLERRAGHPGAAARLLRAGLHTAPGDARLMQALARLAVEQGSVIDGRWWAERAVAARTDASTLTTLAAAQWATGDRDDARFTIASALQLEPGHREALLWSLAHDGDIEAARRSAVEALGVRRDVYGFDLAAWASHRAGRVDDARTYMQQALRLGTRDVQLREHARHILNTP
ncbi:MAG: hypothetical protein LCH84_14015 [Gemmatimonadetes bacterium]|nr:hypothetical protein [Gemmatimonadota bacterium]